MAIVSTRRSKLTAMEYALAAADSTASRTGTYCGVFPMIAAAAPDDRKKETSRDQLLIARVARAKITEVETSRFRGKHVFPNSGDLIFGKHDLILPANRSCLASG